MAITNLSQLKKALIKGAKFEIVEHYLHPEYVGQKRVVQFTQTNAIWSGIDGEPDNPISRINDGRGLFLPFGKASNWAFEDGVATSLYGGRKCFSLRLIGGDVNA